jgi:hypothetical protein
MHPMTSEPGWYPDPWYPQSLRYWDGASWTGYVQAAASLPRLDPGEVATWAKRARASFWILGAVGALSSIIAPLIVSSFVHDIRDSLDTGAEPTGGPSVAMSLAPQPLSIARLVVMVLIAIWTYRATEAARSLGVSTTHSPGWAAASWFVPIVSFWFPYQVMRDLLAPSDPARSKVGLWWALHLIVATTGFLSLVALFASTALALAVGVLGAAASLWGAALAATLVDATTTTALRLADGPGSGTPL